MGRSGKSFGNKGGPEVPWGPSARGIGLRAAPKALGIKAVLRSCAVLERSGKSFGNKGGPEVPWGSVGCARIFRESCPSTKTFPNEIQEGAENPHRRRNRTVMCTGDHVQTAITATRVPNSHPTRRLLLGKFKKSLKIRTTVETHPTRRLLTKESLKVTGAHGSDEA